MIASNRYTYTAREFDNESTTYHYRARNQDPRIGRFLSADPIEYEGGLNLYAYVENNPANFTDPSGFLIPISVLEEMTRKILEEQAKKKADEEKKKKGYKCTVTQGQYEDPNKATIVCDGKGCIKTQLGAIEKKHECIKECVQEHEELHKSDCEKMSPDVCKKMPAGTKIIMRPDKFLKESECTAYKASLECFRRNRKDEECCEVYKELDQLIKKEEGDVKKYCDK